MITKADLTYNAIALSITPSFFGFVLEADFDRDTLPDYFFCYIPSSQAPSCNVYYSTTTPGTFSTNSGNLLQPVIACNPGPSAPLFAVGDYTGDGYPDLFYAGCGNAYSPPLRAFFATNDRTGVLNSSAPSDPRFKLTGGAARFLDVNRDGWLDLFACGNDLSNNSYVGFFLNSNGTAWSSMIQYPVTGAFPAFHISVGVADFDGDGFVDFFLTGIDSSVSSIVRSAIITFFPNGSLSLNPVLVQADGVAQVAGQIANSASVAVFDYNNDNRPDIVFQGSNTGTGSFPAAFALPAGKLRFNRNAFTNPLPSYFTVDSATFIAYCDNTSNAVKFSWGADPAKAVTYNIFVLFKTAVLQTSTILVSPLADMTTSRPFVSRPGNAGHASSYIVKSTVLYNALFNGPINGTYATLGVQSIAPDLRFSSFTSVFITRCNVFPAQSASSPSSNSTNTDSAVSASSLNAILGGSISGGVLLLVV